MKTSTRLNMYASIAAGVAAPAIMLNEYLPEADVVMSIWYVCRAMGAWLAVALLVFAMNWVFFGGLVLLGRWIRDAFYRTPVR